ncbi:hypothetical protein ACNO5M_13365 [Vibrio owensii]|uniref:hypothetical protein n=1 Tax=Vibrio owensii TaxID=696485 RepID=UPI003AAFD82D
MSIATLPDSASGEVTHGQHRQKTNEVVTQLNAIPVINGFQLDVLETELYNGTWGQPNLALDPNVDALNQYAGSELFTLSGQGTLIIDGAKAHAIHYIKASGYIELEQQSGQEPSDVTFEVVAYDPAQYPTLSDMFEVSANEHLVIISRAFIASDKEIRNGVLSGASLWMNKKNESDDSVVSRFGWCIAARAYSSNGSGAFIATASQIAIDVYCNGNE